MSDIQIEGENISKKFLLSLQVESFRDLIIHKASKFYHQVRHPFSESPSSESTEEFWALKDVSFQIRQGDRYGIIGHNGAGKSTLLKILCRITEPTSGRIRMRGTVTSLLEVGTGFHRELTGRENVFLYGAIMGMNKREIAQKYDEIVAFSGVEKFLHTPVKFYSSGMLVRLAFSVAAHMDADIMVIDEALAVGDAPFQAKCFGKMLQLADEGRTIIVVAHHLYGIKSLCYNGLYLQNGQVQFSGSMEQAINRYTASFGPEASLTGALLSRSFAEEGRGKFQLLQVSILDENDQIKATPCTWDSLKIRLYYYAPAALPEVSCTVKVINVLGETLLMRFNTQVGGYPFKLAEGKATLDCVIPRLRLAAGQYRVHVSFRDELASEWLLYEDKIAALVVHPQDVYQSGVSPMLDMCPYAEEYYWESP